MMRSVERYITVEMLSLWVVESVLVAIVLYFVLPHAQTGPGHATHLDLRALQHAMACTLTISVMSVTIGLYRADICLRRDKLMMTALIVSALLAPALVGLSTVFGLGVSLDPGSQTFLPKIFAGWIACLGVTRIGFHLAQRSELFARRVLVIGPPHSAIRIQNVIDASAAGFCRVVGVVAPEAMRPDAGQLRRLRIWAVVHAEECSPDASSYRHLPMFDEAGFCETRLQRLDTACLPRDWTATVARSSARQWVDLVHRGLDILVGLSVLLITLPLVALVGLAIKVESRGPMFYRQERVGRHGRVFMLLKFRSMATNAEAIGAPMWAAKDDPRVTRVGRFIRRTRIDELPQVLNVLSGEMSFIGPRPERPHFVERLSAAIPNYADRVCLKPGITGWAQVKFPYGASVEDARMKLAYDLYYVKHRSVFLNVLIMVATVRVILFQEGAR